MPLRPNRLGLCLFIPVQDSVGNQFLTVLSNMITDLNLSDMEACYKMSQAELLQRVSLEQKRFGFEPEFTVKIANLHNIKIYDVGISSHGRDYSGGKKSAGKMRFRLSGVC